MGQLEHHCRDHRLPVPDSSFLITNCTQYAWGLDLSGTSQGAGGVGGLLAVFKNGTTFFPAYDANGNVTKYITVDGNIAAHREYSAFGETVMLAGNLSDGFTFWWSTKPWCRVTGLNEYELRKYHSDWGRWMSRDIIDEAGGINLYGFAYNRSLDAIDPDGRCAIVFFPGVWIVVGKALVETVVISGLIVVTYQIIKQRLVTIHNYEENCGRGRIYTLDLFQNLEKYPCF
jgi:RHS repeat-associated core domain